jgi:hypothetical protein
MTPLYHYEPAPTVPRWALALEWFVLFLLPVALVGILQPSGLAKYPFLALPFAYAGTVWLIVRPRREGGARRFWRAPLWWVLASIPLLALLTALIDPSLFFGFPRHAPQVYGYYMLLYPIFSVWPQEFLYRRFYFWRYERLFGAPAALLWSSAGTFCLLHAIYGNWIAVVLSLIAGWVFSSHYARSGSLLVVWAEHTAFGWWAFTIGLGRFFYRPL